MMEPYENKSNIVSPKPILKNRYMSSLGLSLVQRLAYPDCYVVNPWNAYHDDRYNSSVVNHL